jgi:hypothetical protein
MLILGRASQRLGEGQNGVTHSPRDGAPKKKAPAGTKVALLCDNCGAVFADGISANEVRLQAEIL